MLTDNEITLGIFESFVGQTGRETPRHPRFMMEPYLFIHLPPLLLCAGHLKNRHLVSVRFGDILKLVKPPILQKYEVAAPPSFVFAQ